MQQSQLAVHAETELTHWWFRARRSILMQIITDALGETSDKLIVDVGCGTGANVAMLTRRFQAIGVDTSLQAIQLARARFPQCCFLEGVAAETLGDRCSEVDLFLLSDVLEHVDDDFEMLSTLFAMAKPRAYFLLTVPADMKLWSRHDESCGHYRRYDRERFTQLWEDLPIKPLFVSHFNSRLYPLIKLIRSVNRWRRKSFGHAATDLRMPSKPTNWLLAKIFAGEQKRLLAVLRGNRTEGYRRGVSLIALLRREEGNIAPRTKPEDVLERCPPARSL